MEKRKLENHQSCQCYVEIDRNMIYFVSYETTVLFCERTMEGTWEINCTGTYSQTTRKQIGYFLKEYFPMLNYYDMKEIAGEEKYLVLYPNGEKEIKNIY